MNLFFHAANRPKIPRKKIVVHPYIYSRTASEVTIGVYCEEPAPVDDTADVVLGHTDGSTTYLFSGSVPIVKGLRDSGQRVVAKVNTQAIPTLDLYRNTTTGSIRFRSSYYKAGAKDVCPTMQLLLSLNVMTSSDLIINQGVYFNPFGTGEVAFVYGNNFHPVLVPSELDDVPYLGPGYGAFLYEKTVEVDRATALSVLPGEINLNASFHVDTNASDYYGQATYALLADGIRETLGSFPLRPYMTPANPDLSAKFGSPTLGDYIHAGVSFFKLSGRSQLSLLTP